MSNQVKVMLSNRHVHLSPNDLAVLFGEGYELTVKKQMGGEFAAEEAITIAGPKGAIENVRIMGPAHRETTQVEILFGDKYKLGINAPVRNSGDLLGSAPITLIGPKGRVELTEGAIVAKRHVHMNLATAAELGVVQDQIVALKCEGERPLVFGDVRVVASDRCREFVVHIDSEEGNAAGLKNGDMVTVIVGT